MLLELLPALQAEETLKKYGSSLEPDAVYDLAMIAFDGNEEIAEELWTQAAEEEQRRASGMA